MYVSQRCSVAVDGARRYDVRRCYAAAITICLLIISRRVVGFCNNNNEWEISKQCFYS